MAQVEGPQRAESLRLPLGSDRDVDPELRILASDPIHDFGKLVVEELATLLAAKQPSYVVAVFEVALHLSESPVDGRHVHDGILVLP